MSLINKMTLLQNLIICKKKNRTAMFTVIKNYVVNYSNLDQISTNFINSIVKFARIRGLKIRLQKKKILYFILLIKYTCIISRQKETPGL